MKTTPATTTKNDPQTLLRNLEPGPFVTITKVKPIGAIQARKATSGITTLYWRYSIGTTSERVVIGTYDPAASVRSVEPSGDKMYSLAAAVKQAEAMSAQHYQHRDDGGRRALIEAAEARKAAAAAKAEREVKYSLGALLDLYIEDQQTLERKDWKDQQSALRIHVKEPFPQLWAKPASAIDREDIMRILRRCEGAGKSRTAGKVRSFLLAAFNRAMRAEQDASVPRAFLEYEVQANPVASTFAPKDASGGADKNPLSGAEMRTYWKQLKATPGRMGALLRLHLLLGAQRTEQLCELMNANVHADHIVLIDPKGRPGTKARRHVVPLIAPAVEALAVARDTRGIYALSSDGETRPDNSWVAKEAAKIAKGAGIVGFSLKRTRSGVETMLGQEAGASREHRGYLQSHGISGVQARHYDASDYVHEKKVLQETLFQLLELEAPVERKVVSLVARQRRKAAA